MVETLYGIAELPTYIRLAEKFLSVEDRQDLINYLAEHPKSGDVMPLYLLTLFAKGDKANLTKAERNELADLIDALVSIWKERTTA